jgi:hypothetical protein
MGVRVAWCDSGTVLGSFAEDLLGMVTAEALNRVVTGWIRLEHGPSMDLARNKVTERFLATGDEWLLQLDTDMGFPPDLASRLLKTADPVERPIVGGLCFGMSADQGVFPTAYLVRDGRFWMVQTLPDEPFQVDGTGAAVLLTHRSVFEKTAECEWPGKWWDRLYYGAQPVGEDLSFCLRCHAVGLPVWIDPTIPIRHYKLHIPLDRVAWDRQQAAK